MDCGIARFDRTIGAAHCATVVYRLAAHESPLNYRCTVSTVFLTVGSSYPAICGKTKAKGSWFSTDWGPMEACCRVRAACNGDLSTAFRASAGTLIGRGLCGRVRSPPPWLPKRSPHTTMRAAALAERLRLLRELRRLDDRHAALVLELEEVGATRDSLCEDIRVLARHSDEDELRPQRTLCATHLPRLTPRDSSSLAKFSEGCASARSQLDSWRCVKIRTSRSTMSTSTNCSPATASRSPAQTAEPRCERNSVDPPSSAQPTAPECTGSIYTRPSESPQRSGDCAQSLSRRLSSGFRRPL